MANNNKVIKFLRYECFNLEDGNKFTNCALIFAYNGTGKTRLSYDFAHYNKRKKEAHSDTLYYNAYTEDLFTWDNDLENNTAHRLLINRNSSLIQGLAGFAFEDQLRKYLQVFTDIDFIFYYDDAKLPAYVSFSKEVVIDGVVKSIENIKISRGEERLFVWCFFRCIIDQVLNGNDAYKNIKYIYIDDPMSSLDDNNVIAFAAQLYGVIRKGFSEAKEAYEAGKTNFRKINFIVSSHHALFFHTMWHGLNADKKLGKYYLSRNKQEDKLILKNMSDESPFYYNVAMMCEIKNAIDKDKLYTYHFTVLRGVIEKIKEFFGYKNYEHILNGIEYTGVTDNPDLTQEDLTEFYSRVMNVLTHQGAMFTPVEMNPDNKELAKAIFKLLINKYYFDLPNLNDYHSEARLAKEKQNKKS